MFFIACFFATELPFAAELPLFTFMILSLYYCLLLHVSFFSHFIVVSFPEQGNWQQINVINTKNVLSVCDPCSKLSYPMTDTYEELQYFF